MCIARWRSTAAYLAAAVYGVYLYIAGSGWRSADFTLGMLVIGLTWCVGLALNWTIYIVSQRTVTLTDEELRVRPWLRIGPFGRPSAISLSDVARVSLVRPHHVIVETHSGKKHHIGTLWWSKHDYGALRAALDALGIPTDYSETWSYGRFLSS